MHSKSELLADIAFVGEVIEWRGPAPFFFVAVPSEYVGELSHAAKLASYGWGVVPVDARLGGTQFTTSLFPRNGGFLLPLKASIRARETVALGSQVAVRLRVLSQQRSS